MGLWQKEQSFREGTFKVRHPRTFPFQRSLSLSPEQSIWCCGHHRLRYSETGDADNTKQEKITPSRRALRLNHAVYKYIAPILALLFEGRSDPQRSAAWWWRFWLPHPVEGPDELCRAYVSITPNYWAKGTLLLSVALKACVHPMDAAQT